MPINPTRAQRHLAPLSPTLVIAGSARVSRRRRRAAPPSPSAKTCPPRALPWQFRNHAFAFSRVPAPIYFFTFLRAEFLYTRARPSHGENARVTSSVATAETPISQRWVRNFQRRSVLFWQIVYPGCFSRLGNSRRSERFLGEGVFSLPFWGVGEWGEWRCFWGGNVLDWGIFRWFRESSFFMVLILYSFAMEIIWLKMITVYLMIIRERKLEWMVSMIS